MYIAIKEFKSYALGTIKKGQQVEEKQAWIDAGLIEKSQPKVEIETKPEPKKKIKNKGK
jgi:hypothetical protein